MHTYMIMSCVCETWERMSPTWSEASCKIHNIMRKSYHSNGADYNIIIATCLLITIHNRMNISRLMFLQGWWLLIHFDWIRGGPKPTETLKFNHTHSYTKTTFWTREMHPYVASTSSAIDDLLQLLYMEKLIQKGHNRKYVCVRKKGAPNCLHNLLLTEPKMTESVMCNTSICTSAYRKIKAWETALPYFMPRSGWQPTDAWVRCICSYIKISGLKHIGNTSL